MKTKIKIPKEVYDAILESLDCPIDPDTCSFGPAYEILGRKRSDAISWILKNAIGK